MNRSEESNQDIIHNCLIDLIEQYPCIYKKNCSTYKIQDEVDKAWTIVAEQLSEICGENISVQCVKEEWRKLVENFKSCYYLNKNTPSGSAYKETKCPFYDRLMFLADHIRHRDTYSTDTVGRSSIWNLDMADKSKKKHNLEQKVPEWDASAKKKKKELVTAAGELQKLSSAIENNNQVLKNVLKLSETESHEHNVFYEQLAALPKEILSDCVCEILSLLEKLKEN